MTGRRARADCPLCGRRTAVFFKGGSRADRLGWKLANHKRPDRTAMCRASGEFVGSPQVSWA